MEFSLSSFWAKHMCHKQDLQIYGLLSLFVETLVKPQKRMVKWKHGVFPPLQTGHTPEPATQNDCYQGAVILPLDHGGYTVGCNGVYSPL